MCNKPSLTLTESFAFRTSRLEHTNLLFVDIMAVFVGSVHRKSEASDVEVKAGCLNAEDFR